jgi:hypothetical protein
LGAESALFVKLVRKKRANFHQRSFLLIQPKGLERLLAEIFSRLPSVAIESSRHKNFNPENPEQLVL